MITIKRSTAVLGDTSVTKDQLLRDSELHIRDVCRGLGFFCSLLETAGIRHDSDKITDIDTFYADFMTGFAKSAWWSQHRQLNRHHLTKEDGIPLDVNLLDVLDHIADCVMAGKARTGEVYALYLPPELLERAFQNTVELLKRNVKVGP